MIREQIHSRVYTQLLIHLETLEKTWMNVYIELSLGLLDLSLSTNYLTDVAPLSAKYVRFSFGKSSQSQTEEHLMMTSVMKTITTRNINWSYYNLIPVKDYTSLENMLEDRIHQFLKICYSSNLHEPLAPCGAKQINPWAVLNWIHFFPNTLSMRLKSRSNNQLNLSILRVIGGIDS